MTVRKITGAIFIVCGVICIFMPRELILSFMGIILGVIMLGHSTRLFGIYRAESLKIGNPSKLSLIFSIITAVVGILALFSFKFQFLAGKMLICLVGICLIVIGAERSYNNLKYKLSPKWKEFAFFNILIILIGTIFIFKAEMVMSFIGICCGFGLIALGGYMLK